MRGQITQPEVQGFNQPIERGSLKTLTQGQEVEVLETWHRVKADGTEVWLPASALALNEQAKALPLPNILEETAEKLLIVRIEPYQGHNFVGESIRADREFHSQLDLLDSFAGSNGLKIHTTQSFRRRDSQLQGAIVPPAKRSNHLVGHAIDMNLILGDNWFNSRKLARSRRSSLPEDIKNFIQAIRDADQLRWGGDFASDDPVHIDDNLYNRNPDLWSRKYEAL